MLRRILITLIASLTLTGLVTAEQPADDLTAHSENYQTAIFAGGCFWCVESDFDAIPGVVKTTSGYIGGHTPDPSYKEVSAGKTGHAEAVKIVYDPDKVSYQSLVNKFWYTVDPTTPDRQFCDTGSQYRTAIFYLNAQQKTIAEESKSALEKSKPFKAPIVTELTEATTFYPAEDYHQDYYKKNPIRYKFYRHTCGRDQRLAELWETSNTVTH